MRTFEILSTPNGLPGVPAKIGEIHGDGAQLDRSGGWLPSAAADELISLLSDGFMERQFHLVDGDVGYSNCRITKIGGPGNGARLVHMGTFRA